MNEKKLTRIQLHKSEYSAWRDARNRTCDDKHRRWSDYGGRGITMCERWKISFDNFLDDMGAKISPDLSLDRIDNDKGYSPDNCRWATREEQAANKRVRKDAHLLTIDGITKPISDWARENGLDAATIRYRQRKRKLTGVALIAPPDPRYQNRHKRH